MAGGTAGLFHECEHPRPSCLSLEEEELAYRRVHRRFTCSMSSPANLQPTSRGQIEHDDFCAARDHSAHVSRPIVCRSSSVHNDSNRCRRPAVLTPIQAEVTQTLPQRQTAIPSSTILACCLHTCNRTPPRDGILTVTAADRFTHSQTSFHTRGASLNASLPRINRSLSSLDSFAPPGSVSQDMLSRQRPPARSHEPLQQRHHQGAASWEYSRFRRSSESHRRHRATSTYTAVLAELTGMNCSLRGETSLD